MIFPTLIDDSRLDSYLIALKSLTEKKTVEWVFPKNIRISPAGMAILCCLVEAAKEKEVLIHFIIRGRRKTDALHFLNHLNSHVLSHKGVVSPSLYDYESENSLLIGRPSGLDLGFMEKMEPKFQLSDDLDFDCRLILQELMQNSIDHSGGERYFMYAGLWEKEIHCGVLDMGVSIPAKLRQKYDQPDDIQLLLLALKEGSTTRRERTGGLGLSHFRDVLRRNKGKLTVASGWAQIRFYFQTRNAQKSTLKYRLPGSWCFARIPWGGP